MAKGGKEGGDASASARAALLACGAVMGAFPAYVFSQALDLPMSEYALLLLPVSVLVGGLLFNGYTNISKTSLPRFVQERKADSLDVATGRATAYALCVGNAIFILLFCFFAFFMFRSFSTTYNFTLSSSFAAAAAWYFSVLTK